MSEKRMKKSKMSGENEIATMPISTLFVAVNLPEIYRVINDKLKSNLRDGRKSIRLQNEYFN